MSINEIIIKLKKTPLLLDGSLDNHYDGGQRRLGGATKSHFLPKHERKMCFSTGLFNRSPMANEN